MSDCHHISFSVSSMDSVAAFSPLFAFTEGRLYSYLYTS